MKVKITEFTRNPMQSSPKQNGFWELTFIEEENSRYINDRTGWTSSNNTNTQLKLKFSTKKDAIRYAERKNLEYTLDCANKSSIKPKSYSENFLQPIL
jgi:hypothetical protein